MSSPNVRVLQDGPSGCTPVADDRGRSRSAGARPAVGMSLLLRGASPGVSPPRLPHRGVLPRRTKDLGASGVLSDQTEDAAHD
jgi:hypothetical protein